MIQLNSLKAQLSAVFFFFLLLVVVLGLFSIEQLSDVNWASADIRDRWLQSTRILGDLNNFTSDYRAAEANLLLASSSEMVASTEREIVELDHSIMLAKQSYEQIQHGEAESDMYKQFSSEWSTYEVLANQVFKLSRAHHTADGSRLYMTQSRTAYSAASNMLGKLTSLTVAGASVASSRAATTHQVARNLIIGAIVLAVFSMIGVLRYITRSISQPLHELAERMHSLASNDMDIDIKGTQRHDEIGEMARAVMVFRNNAVELAQSQRGLIQQALMLEEKLEYEQRLTSLQRNFLSMASHEFRTPLTIVDGHAQRLIKLKEGLQPHEIAERAEKIRTAVLRMTSVIDNLLTSSRLFDGDAELYFHPAKVDVAKLLQDVCQLHREISIGAKIQEYFNLLPTTIITGDSQLLFQALSNLISNAIKYSPNAGQISISAAAESDYVVVKVKDHGIGIPAQDCAHIFDRYHRGSNVKGITGTGIGLYLVKMVISLHGGDVSVSSTEGQGSEFTVRLPFET